MPTAAKIPKGAVQMYCSLCSGIGGSLWAEYPASCKAQGLNPFEWLKYTLENVHLAKPSQLNQYLPRKREM